MRRTRFESCSIRQSILSQKGKKVKHEPLIFIWKRRCACLIFLAAYEQSPICMEVFYFIAKKRIRDIVKKSEYGNLL